MDSVHRRNFAALAKNDRRTICEAYLYAFATTLTNLRLMIPGTVNGKIQLAPGYRRFFIWVLISAIPAIILSRLVPIRSVAAGPATPSIEA